MIKVARTAGRKLSDWLDKLPMWLQVMIIWLELMSFIALEVMAYKIHHGGHPVAGLVLLLVGVGVLFHVIWQIAPIHLPGGY